MKRSFVGIARGITMAAVVMLPVVTHAQGKPIIAIWPYDNNSSVSNRADFQGMEKGVADLFITDIAAGGKVRVVERGRINQILDEQKLARDGAVDPETAVRLGKLLGACYSIVGQFMALPGGTINMTARMVSIETGQVDPMTVKVTKKTDDLMGLIDEVSTKVQAQLKLTGCPTGGVPRSGSAAPAPAAQQGGTKAATAPATTAPKVEEFAKVITPEQAKATIATKLDPKTALLYSKGLDAMDNKDPKKAADLFAQVKTKYPTFQPAIDNYAKATK